MRTLEPGHPRTGATAISEILESHNSPSIWGKSDCISLAKDFIRLKSKKSLVLPSWAKTKGGKTRTFRKIVLDAPAHGGLYSAWQDVLDPLFERTQDCEPGDLGLSSSGDICVVGNDYLSYARTESGLQIVESELYWRVK